MEQIFKFNVEEVRGVENLKKMMSEDFIEKTRLRFNDMFLSMKELA
jgi:hypothetical protein